MNDPLPFPDRSKRHPKGSKVMLIRAYPSRLPYSEQPVLHTVYTVRGYHSDFGSGQWAAMWVEEIRNPGYGTPDELTFFFGRFVPVLSKRIATIEKLRLFCGVKQTEPA